MSKVKDFLKSMEMMECEIKCQDCDLAPIMKIIWSHCKAKNVSIEKNDEWIITIEDRRKVLELIDRDIESYENQELDIPFKHLVIKD